MNQMFIFINLLEFFWANMYSDSFKRDFEASFLVQLDSKYVWKIQIRETAARFVCRWLGYLF